MHLDIPFGDKAFPLIRSNGKSEKLVSVFACPFSTGTANVKRRHTIGLDAVSVEVACVCKTAFF